MNFKQAYIYLILLILQGVELYLRSYIIDKQRVKDGWSYIMILFKGKYFSKQKSEHKEQARISFEKAKPFPTLQDISI